jgi:hypothetical protein
VQFYGLLHLMMPTEVPYYEQELIGVALLQYACNVGTRGALQTAVAMARELVFEMGGTTPWLTATFQDARYVITDHVMNGAPVWAAEDCKCFVWRDLEGMTMISDEANCDAEHAISFMHNTGQNLDILAPTQLPTTQWMSCKASTLEPQYTGFEIGGTWSWVNVPDMRVTAVHGVDDAEPAMAAALRQLAALTGAEYTSS